MLNSKAWGMFNQLVIHASTLCQTEGETSIIGVYVDDLVIAAKSTAKINEIKSALSQKV